MIIIQLGSSSEKEQLPFQSRMKWNKNEKKTVKGGGDFVNIWNLCQKMCGLTSINPNILALKHERDIEQHASNAFFEIFKCNHKKPKSCNCWLFLGGKRSFIGVSSHGIVECASRGQV